MGSNHRPEDRKPRSWRASIVAAARGAANYYYSLSECMQVVVGVVVVLTALIVPPCVIIYRTEIGAAAVFLLLTVLATGCVGAIIYLAVAFWRGRRAARDAAEARRVEAWSIYQRNREAVLRAIAEGTYSASPDPGPFVLRNSESLWFRCPARLANEKGVAYGGELYVTSMRVVFLCDDYAIDIPIPEINGVVQHVDGVKIICKTARKTGLLNVADPELTIAHVRRSIQVFHRQVDLGFEADDDRRITQDVKAAVWQRDGGRCVQCGAKDYLEFDHIIPHAKGGANTVQNVQLLCRRCNLKKGAAI